MRQVRCVRVLAVWPAGDGTQTRMPEGADAVATDPARFDFEFTGLDAEFTVSSDKPDAYTVGRLYTVRLEE